jgi:hypothetical protein
VCATAGKWWDGSSCATCTAGYYCTGNGNRVACPSGTTSSEGATNSVQCTIPMGHYCAPTNKNECTPNAAWAGGSNVVCGSGSWPAWDGYGSYTTAYKARENSYGIKASTWACKNSSTLAPSTSGDAQCRSGAYCWCAYSKSPDTTPSTFTSGAWSSWVYRSTSGSVSGCASNCALFCALNADASIYGGAVSW